MPMFHSSGVFAAVKRHFNDPQIFDSVRLSATSKGGHVSLSLTEADEVLHGPTADEDMAASIWREVIREAKDEADPHGPWRLVLIRLALPRLTGTVYRICARLRASRPDIESEMVIALLETLRSLDPNCTDAPATLLKAARDEAWRFARSVRQVIPVGHIEAIAKDHDHPGADQHSEPEDYERQEAELEVTPPAGPDGLRSTLRFRLSTAQLEGERLGELAGRLELHEVVRKARRTRRKRRTGTTSPHPRRKRR